MNVVSITQLAEKFTKEDENKLRETFPMHQFSFYNEVEIPEDILKQSDILITMRRTAHIMKRMPNLKWTHVVNAGLNDVPFDYLRDHNIVLTSVKGVHKIPIAEYTIGMMLSLVKNSYSLYDLQKKGSWSISTAIDEIHGKTLGILGLGGIGSEIAKRANAFGMNVLALRRTPSQTPDYVQEIIPYAQKERIFRNCDFIVVILPLTEETINFIGQEELSMMKDTAYIINIARGPIIEEKALINSLRGKKIKGAVLDVFDQEPLPSDHPLWQLDNVIITPHMAGHSPNTLKRAMDILIENLKAYPDQKNMINVIDLQKEY
ncbi:MULTISPECIES: D-2-hydroxyacid dehydrogenase [unclassified Paenibacillus]|uniref:D-2-hydroxyacid dehydrogenase n=1 Tax=unclassified Paenibacillus TaxID=185978 RepID=UPI001AE156EF|nr:MULTISPECIES: D-2-hydroxyacid dehydrogenase [unclassified Paenibacillus]MBP1155406.1 phosphoglycerate dehydrogenase-like enzyme [Paenibacillus sp. PvP091]MBP1169209.1 phosphoglycerate dehydrogenase-like enzyme [Paenibacillus sp. PvR098]MBP2440237.1 phosphoglycerate dehydrogenase-like enzyme [Paenibacillus sp. PvP052]